MLQDEVKGISADWDQVGGLSQKQVFGFYSNWNGKTWNKSDLYFKTNSFCLVKMFVGEPERE